MPPTGYIVNLGSKRKHETKGRKPQSHLLPPANPPPTDPILSNLNSLVDVSYRPMFSEMYERGRGNITAFASDFLNVSLEKNGQRHDGMEQWWHEAAFASERHLSSGNRWGKSFSEAIKVLHHAFYQTRPPEHAHLTNEYRILILSLTIDMAKIIWEYAMRLALDSSLFFPFVVQSEIKTAPFPSLIIGSPKTTRNGFRSEIAARSSAKDARYILGRKYDFIVYDECARDPHGDKILDEVIRMRLADRNGRIDMVSTAAGKNWFWKAFQRGKMDEKNGNIQFYSKTGSTLENPFIDHDRVRQNQEIMARQWVEQNIYGGFADFLNVFDRAQIEDMYEEVHYSLCSDYNDIEKLVIDPDAKYIMAIDWALKRDETVIIVARVDENGRYIRGERDKAKEGQYQIVFLQGFSVKPTGSRYTWDELKTITVQIHKKFNSARCLFDSTGLAGEMIYQDLSMIGMNHHEGYDFAGGSSQAKDHLIVVGQQALQNGIFKIPYTPMSQNLIDQLLLYDREDKGLPTDYVFAFCLLAENLRRANLPISELLSQPLLFGIGNRQLGRGQHPFDNNYEVNMPGLTRRPNPLLDGILISNRGYDELVA